jgi:hypothetical protein
VFFAIMVSGVSPFWLNEPLSAHNATPSEVTLYAAQASTNLVQLDRLRASAAVSSSSLRFRLSSFLG